MNGPTRYTAEALAARVGLPVRTVRFYLRERMIDPPLGRGRGAHFDDRHVDQLERVRWMRGVGLDLETIRTAGAETEALLAQRGLQPGHLSTSVGWPAPEYPPEDESDGLNLASAIRIPMADGVELLVDPDKPIPSPRQLVEIALLIRKAFGR
ncbi:MAG TPA: MerR family transcriptional regulator [Caulobacteraceae bacterium]|jgi:DNA-binding transcriptional MerR regulator|nr:MerR family transcriptional regulator [Caulobacteraceae bacterium]